VGIHNEYKQKLGSKQAHHVMRWLRILRELVSSRRVWKWR